MTDTAVVRERQRPIEFPGVNGCVVCDHGHVAFRVGVMRDPKGNNFIQCLECVECGQKLAVPFFSNAAIRKRSL